MNISCLDEKVKEIILSEIFISEYKEVMRLSLDGKSCEQIADIVNYSTRQVQRIIPLCWREVCVRLAQKELEK